MVRELIPRRAPGLLAACNVGRPAQAQALLDLWARRRTGGRRDTTQTLANDPTAIPISLDAVIAAYRNSSAIAPRLAPRSVGTDISDRACRSQRH